MGRGSGQPVCRATLGVLLLCLGPADARMSLTRPYRCAPQACRLVESVMARLFVPAIVLHTGPDDVRCAPLFCGLAIVAPSTPLAALLCAGGERGGRQAAPVHPLRIHERLLPQHQQGVPAEGAGHAAEQQQWCSGGAPLHSAGDLPCLPAQLPASQPATSLPASLPPACPPACLQGLQLLPALNGKTYADLPERAPLSHKTFNSFSLSVTKFKKTTSDAAVLRV